MSRAAKCIHCKKPSGEHNAMTRACPVGKRTRIGHISYGKTTYSEKPSKRVALVACSSLKAQEPVAARDLYVSPLFKKSRAWAERNCDEWMILSAKHGLVNPGVVLEPYDLSLHEMSRAERIAWSDNVSFALNSTYTDNVVLVWLTGELYRVATRHRCEEPMKGLQIGERLGWLNKELAS